MLRALIATYLCQVGFTTYEHDGITYWHHPNLGGGRYFNEAVAWWIGTEEARANGLDIAPPEGTQNGSNTRSGQP